MVPLNRFRNNPIRPCLSAIGAGKLSFFLLLSGTVLSARVIHFFDPVTDTEHASLSLKTGYFVANDAVSLDQFLRKWSRHYHPKPGENIALQDMRLDVGKQLAKNLYVGYFYRNNLFIKSNKDFADLYQKAKNKIDLDPSRLFLLELEARGLKQSGLIIAGEKTVWQTGLHRFRVGAAASLSVGLDMQKGYISGIATVPNAKTYQIDAQTRYHYTHNYLYDLNVDQAYGMGYGFDLALQYRNSAYRFDISLVINDLLARIYWKDLPYSYVAIQTKNKSYDETGYVKYTPSVRGVETTKEYTQHIGTKYRLQMGFSIDEKSRFAYGLSYAYSESFPYMQFHYELSQKQEIGTSYEARFGSVGVDYRYGNFYFGLASDGIAHPSALGIRGGYRSCF